ncbi:hepatocellular carcinoma-associated antigen 59-domain-containing protein [Jackrogersella minutella]|nr:hepatocellular carcinoma-associated antigen 59-domain-containing protein [Jackrogersella minutella]
MENNTTSEATPEPQVVFRGKKRKTYRQRPEPASDTEEPKSVEAPQREKSATASDAPTPTQSEDATEEEKGLSVAEILRLRNARKARLGGVKFGAGSNHTSGDATAAAIAEAGDGLDDLSLMIREEENKALDISSSVKKRFAPQTGLATEIVNKHMEEYIEAQLAKRHNAIASSSSSRAGTTTTHSQSSNQQPRTTEPTTITAPKPGNPNRALQGQLMEIDLGDEARSRNEALTERATRKMQGEAVEDEEQAGGRPRKVRLGRDGKPWRSRNRRNSDDIRRDQLVEEILRENRHVYETPTPPPAAGASGANDDSPGAADDRLAEEFRREFMDAQAERQQKRKKPTNAPPTGAAAKGGAKDEDVLKGPKLGGSRNVRAAMRNLLLEKAKEGKKPGR